MFLRAKNGQVTIENTIVDYIAFGCGKKNLIMLPGLGDGLVTVRGKALPFALMYRMYARNYRVFVMSRGRNLHAGCTTRDMAEEVFLAMRQLGLETADVVGISQGGMIAQWLAIDHPDAVDKLVLTVTAARAGDEIREAIDLWKDQVQNDAFTALMQDNLTRMYTEDYLKKNPWMMLTAGKFGKPKSFDRFLAMADACVTHNAYDALGQIFAPTLVISGGKDRVIGTAAGQELSCRIPNAKLHLYPALGHALYEEAQDFNDIVLQFLQEQN